MYTEDNLHCGHRERLREKFLKAPNAFLDYEVLELLLFTTIPRANTNGIAHKLLQQFGSLENVFSATPEQLVSVHGIGLKSATEIVLFGEIYKRLSAAKKKKEFFGFSAEKNKDFFISYFEGLKFENFLVILLDKNMQKLTQLSYADGGTASVSADMPGLANSIAILKPKYIIIAHNHPSGNATPSDSDNLATLKFIMLCNIHGVKLLDHVIVAQKETYSYYLSGMLDKIYKQSNIDNLIDNKKEISKWIE